MNIDVRIPPAGTKFVCEISPGYSAADLVIYCHIAHIEPDLILAHKDHPPLRFNRATKKWEQINP